MNMEKLVFDTLVSNEYCDKVCVINFIENGFMISSLGFNVSEAEVKFLSFGFEDNSRISESGFTLAGVDYCALRYLQDEIYAKKKGNIDLGVVCLKTRTCIVIAHFKKTIHMGNCVVALGKVKSIIQSVESLIAEPTEERVSRFLTPSPIFKKRNKKEEEEEDFEEKKKEEEEDEGEDSEEAEEIEEEAEKFGENINFLLDSGFCDFAAVINNSGQICSKAKNFRKEVKFRKDELVTVINAFEDASGILERGFDAGGVKYCALNCSTNEIYAKEKGNQEKGLVMMKNSSGEYIILAHFDGVQLQGNLAHVVGKVRDKM